MCKITPSDIVVSSYRVSSPTENVSKFAFIDSETIGLHGMMVLFQYAIDNGDIHLYEIWKRPVGETLDLLEWIASHTVVGFNLAFDWFHVTKIFTIWKLCPRDWIPEEHIEEIALLEPLAQNGPCLKPANCLDLLMHSRKGPYQSLMARSDIRIRRVPTALAYALAEELEKRIQIDGIFFARNYDPEAPKWQVYDINRDGEFDPNFKDVVLRFSPAGGLKFLAEHALGHKPKYHYQDIEIDRSLLPKELGYAPIALAVSSPDKQWEVWTKDKKNGKKKLAGYAWPALIKHHILHWNQRADAREYATDDIVYTRELYHHFKCPEAGDDDSVLTCMVPIVRWHGFATNNDGMHKLLEAAQARIDQSPININKPAEVRAYIGVCMDSAEALVLKESTKKANIKQVAMWEVPEPEECTKCKATGEHADGFCMRCNGTGTMTAVCEITDDHGNHPAAVRAAELLAIKTAAKEVELYRKLLRAGKFHASFVVIGTLSTRMSGADGLNAQGIKASKEVRAMFPLAWAPVDRAGMKSRLMEILGERWEEVWNANEHYYVAEQFQLCGGDFDSFEVTLADAVYQDPDLRKALVTKMPCHKCDAKGYIQKCIACKGKGKVNKVSCGACEGKGRLNYGKLYAEAKRDFEHVCNLKDCDECETTGKTTQKIHALFAMCLFPGKTYEQIVASAGTSNDMYTKGKQGVFAMIYGGDFNTLVRNLGIAVDVAEAAFENWNKMFPRSAKAREKTFKQFCSMKQPMGLGSQVVWADPHDYVESFLGFRRYFTLENMITKELFRLANAVPKAWKDCQIKVLRRQKVQTAGGAVSSALYGAAFQIQAANQRAAANHEIQSPGGQITKKVQRAIWDLQPAGVNPIFVAPMNVHDEIMCVTHPAYVTAVADAVQKEVEEYRTKVPLIGMTWNLHQDNWAEKKGGSTTRKVRAPEMMLAA